MTPDDYCQQKTVRSGSSFYYSFLFLPTAQRRAITALYAYCREVDDVVDRCKEPSIARIKLNWWREETDRLYKQTPRHPVTRALLTPVQQFQLAQEHFTAIIDGMQMDLDQRSYASFAELADYCYHAAGVVGLLAAKIFGYQNPATEDYAKNLGIAMQLTNILRDIREDVLRQRIYIPLDEMRSYRILPKDLQATTASPELVALLRQQAERAQDFYGQAYRLLPDEDRYRQRCGLIMAAIYQDLLQKITRLNYPVLSTRVAISPWRKLWLAVKTAHQQARYQTLAARQ